MKSRTVLIICLSALIVAQPVFAQQPPPVDPALARPPNLEPVPDGPPDPPKGSLTDAAKAAADRDALEKSGVPLVTIREDGDTKVEEYRVHGRLYAIRVTPKVGLPYTMVDNEGKGNFVPASDPAGVSVHPPRWTIVEF